MAELRFPTNPPGRAFNGTTRARRRRLDPAIAWAFGCIALVLLIGSLYSSSFLSPQYLLQQLKVASFLGVIATGAMIVILLGQIDLSVPWVVAVGGMMATAATGWGAFGEALAIPTGIGCGVALGIVNGIGVAAVFLLTRTTFGRTVYAIGNRERAAYLSGARTRMVVMTAFAIAGGLSAFGGVLLAGYASKAAQAMGDPYLLPAIAAVVLGGTSILGGRGNYLGTVAGVILITLLQSILSVMQMPEFGRHVTYGVVIIAMLLIYGRGRKHYD